jgi:hypothetical protein
MMSGWKFNLFWSSAFGWFGSSEGQLGVLGPGVQSREPGLVEVPALSAIQPLWGACGEKFALILDDGGDIWGCGDGFGQVWRKLSPQPGVLPARFVAAGKERWAVLPNGAGVWTGGDHILGSDVHFVDVAVGRTNYIAITADGELWSWGAHKGCGQGRKFRSDAPQRIQRPGIAAARCFSWSASSFVLDREGGVCACGPNSDGQAGLGVTGKSNVFTPVAFPGLTERIVDIQCGEDFTIFLTKGGKLWGCGKGDNDRLMNGSTCTQRSPVPCSKMQDIDVCAISVGYSHVICQVGAWSVLQHPILGTDRRRGFPSFRVACPPLFLDLSFPIQATFGLTLAQRVEDGNRPFRFCGGRSGISAAITKTGSAITFTPIASLAALVAKTKISPGHIEEKGRSTRLYRLTVTTKDLLPFGFLPNEEVTHDDFQRGQVLGAFGGRLWFKWAGDSGIASGENCDPFALHSLLKIVKSPRTIARIVFRGRPISLETAPCALLGRYNLQVQDLVRVGVKFGFVNGQFGIFLVFRRLVSDELELVLPTACELIARDSDQPAVKTVIAFNGTPVKVRVSFTPDDPLRPGDRIATQKGAATVVGKSDTGWWIQTDSAKRLNVGLLDYNGPFRLIRRLWDLKGLGTLYAGDIVTDGSRNHLLTFTTGKFEIEADGQRRPVRDGLKLVARPDIPGTTVRDLRGSAIRLSVNTADFQGLRVFPGDEVECDKGKFTVSGMFEGHVLFQGEDGANCVLQQQAVLEPNALRIVKFGDRPD